MVDFTKLGDGKWQAISSASYLPYIDVQSCELVLVAADVEPVVIVPSYHI